MRHARDITAVLAVAGLTILLLGRAGRSAPATAAVSGPGVGAGPASLPAPPAAGPLRPYTAFAWHFPGPRPRVKPLYWVGRAVPPGVAAQTTRRMDAGARVLLMIDLVADLLQHPDDVCLTPDGKPTRERGVWPDRGVRAVAGRIDAYLGGVAAGGGAVDMLVLDFEDGYSMWLGSMTDARLAAIGADPRFPALAGRLGFADARLAAFDRSGPAGEYVRWNAVGYDLVAAALNRAVFGPLRRHFPDAGMCNFAAAALAREHVVPDVNGHMQHTVGDPPGTHQSPVVYGGWTPGRPVPADWTRPYLHVVYAANLVRGSSRSSRMPQLPWVGFKGWRGDDVNRPIAWGRTDYWDEGAFHVMLSGGTDNLLYFNPKDLRQRPGDPTSGAAQPADDDAMEAVLADAERQAGGHRIVAPLSTAPVAWDAPFVVSSARLADGSTLARVTFSERAVSADLTVGGRAVRVHRPAGKVGAWLRVQAR